MRNNSKGFTLIELLAVIVILAIIALITTPIILNVIEDARVNAAEDKAWGTIDAVRLSFTKAQTDTSAVGIPYTVNFPKGNSKGTETTDYGTNADGSGYGQGYINDQPVQASGEMPESGFVTIRDDGTIVAHQLKFGNYYCSTMNSEGTELNANAMTCSRSIDAVTVDSAANDQHNPKK